MNTTRGNRNVLFRFFPFFGDSNNRYFRPVQILLLQRLLRYREGGRFHSSLLTFDENDIEMNGRLHRYYVYEFVSGQFFFVLFFDFKKINLKVF